MTNAAMAKSEKQRIKRVIPTSIIERRAKLVCMTYYGSKELAASFRTVRKNTIIAAGEITEERYGYQVAPGTRTVAQLLTHIAVLPRLPEQIHFVEKRTTFEGFDFFGAMGALIAEEHKLRSKAEIIELLQIEGERFAQLLDGVTEEFLAQHVTYPQGMLPPSKSRFEMLLSVKEHEMHHRAQLMLIQRLLGVVPHLTRDMQARIEAMKAAKA
jgi:uncharacterized damage-inducible protein DinB